MVVREEQLLKRCSSTLLLIRKCEKDMNLNFESLNMNLNLVNLAAEVYR